MRAGRVTPNGGVYIQMHHLGPDNVRKLFKGMVERCADSGFDLANGLVEVVPTAHYMMGGVVFKADTSTDLPGLFAAGEDTGGVHGANRLGGNGVANSTVFGGIAGDTMAQYVNGRALLDYDLSAIEKTITEHRKPLTQAAGDIEFIRDELADCMWDQVGILRNRNDLEAARDRLNRLDEMLQTMGVGDTNPAFNLTWQDWMNLRNLLLVSKTVVEAALARENSRGAHYREDFPEEGDLDTSYYTAVRLVHDQIQIDKKPVVFSMVKPGETILVEA
jgi:fumarate reductase flavoprotein subunit